MDKFLCLLVTVLKVSSASSLYAEGANRITNGLPAAENQFPYMVSLQQLSQVHTTTNRGHKCGGALVTLQHALTSAVCTLERIIEPPYYQLSNPAEYRVFAGSVLLTNDTSAARIRRIANFTIHPEYMNYVPNWHHYYDIAVIILGTPFSNSVARLTIRDVITEDSEVIMCTFTGWGRGTRLHHTQLAVLSENLCRRTGGQFITPGMVCGWSISSGARPAAYAELGDDGGPYVCEGRLLGILVEIRSSTPDVFIRAANFTTWINHVVAQPIAELGPEPSTLPPPTTTTTTTTTTTPSPGGASTFQPGMTVLVVAIAQIITVNVINKNSIKIV